MTNFHVLDSIHFGKDGVYSALHRFLHLMSLIIGSSLIIFHYYSEERISHLVESSFKVLQINAISINCGRLEFAHDLFRIEQVQHLLEVAGSASQEILHLLEFEQLSWRQNSLVGVDGGRKVGCGHACEWHVVPVLDLGHLHHVVELHECHGIVGSSVHDSLHERSLLVLVLPELRETCLLELLVECLLWIFLLIVTFLLEEVDHEVLCFLLYLVCILIFFLGGRGHSEGLACSASSSKQLGHGPCELVIRHIDSDVVHGSPDLVGHQSVVQHGEELVQVHLSALVGFGLLLPSVVGDHSKGEGGEVDLILSSCSLDVLDSQL